MPKDQISNKMDLFHWADTTSKGGDYLRVLLSWALVILASFSNALALAWVHDRVPYDLRGLPDIWFSFFPVAYPRAIAMAEWIIVGSVSCLVALIFFHNYSARLIRRLLAIASICYLCRAICICSTQLPVPSPLTYCSPRAPNGTPGFTALLRRTSDIYAGFGLNMLHERAFCGDLVYSGHTIILFLCYNMFRRYLPENLVFLAIFSKFLNFFAIICILLARKHYTLDVVLAYWITSHVFWVYHALLAYKLEGVTSGRCGSGHIFWHGLFDILERGVEKEAENRFKEPWVFRVARGLVCRLVCTLKWRDSVISDDLENIVV